MSDKKKNLTSRQKRAIAALMIYPTLEKAAEDAGVNEKTLKRWREDPAFRQALTEAEGEAIGEVSRRLILLSGAACDTLADILAGEELANLAQRRMASVSVLDHMLRLRELRVLEERLTALEAAVFGVGK